MAEVRTLFRGYRYKLAPTPEQAAAFAQFAGVCRLVYNLALEQRRDFWRQHQRATGRHISYLTQARELTQLRAEFDWVADVSQTCQQQALRDLDCAYAAFFAGRARYPRPRRKGVDDCFRFQGREVAVRRLNAKWAAVRLPKIGWVKVRWTRDLAGPVKNVTVSRDALGWHVAFACELHVSAPAATDGPAVGIDRGVAATLALSTGELRHLPGSLEAIERRKRKAQRVLARRQRGSRRHAKQQARVAALSARAARVRRHWLHETTTGIARRFATVVIEDLRVRDMTTSARGTVDAPGRHVRAKAGLNRAILSQGWHNFEVLLAYKLAERGGHLVKVAPQFTSQTCSACGTRDARSRKSQAAFDCVACGHRTHADVNAAIVILRRNTASMPVEEPRERPGEAGTGREDVRCRRHLALP